MAGRGMKAVCLIIASASEVMTGATAVPSTGCTTAIKRRLLPGFVPKIIPTPSEDGMVIVWQDSEEIQLQRYDRECESVGDVISVNTSQEFWRNPGRSGLAAAAGLGGGATVVAWTLGSDVWLRVINSPDSGRASSGVVRANGAARFDRADVRIIANPAGDGFVVAWSSWMEDGDGWGVFARPFAADASPLSDQEIQVNQAWQHFQWQSQLAWCGKSLWALWYNGTGGSCPAGVECTTGPFVRRIAASTSEPLGTRNESEIRVQSGSNPLTSALTCAANGSDDAFVLWLTPDSTQIDYSRIDASTGVQEAPQRVPKSWPHDVPTVFRRRLTSRSGNTFSSLTSFLHPIKDSLMAFLGRVRVEATQAFVPVAAEGTFDLSAGSPLPPLGASPDGTSPGEISFIANKDLLVVMSNSLSGGLYVELIQLLDANRGTRFPRRQLGSGSQTARATWDTSEDLAFLVCWVAGGMTKEDQPSRFVCSRRKISWFVDDDGLELGGKLGLLIMVSFIAVYCCIRNCNQNRGIGRQLPVNNRRRFPLAERGRQRNGTAQARVRELRQQLAEIPDTAQETPPMPDREGSAPGPAASAALEVEEGGDASSSDARCTSFRTIGNECSICQNEVAVRVVLQPCGHTACKICVTRIIEMTPSACPFCRSAIEGVQTVYL